MGKPSVDEIWASLKSSTMKKASDAMNGVRKAQSDLATSNAAAATPSSGGREEGIKGNGEETRAEKSLADLQDLSVEGIMGALRRDINCLTDSNRTTRRSGAERLRSRLLEDEKFAERALATSGDEGRDVLSSVLTDPVLVPMSRMLNDQAEKCREASLLFVKSAAVLLPDTSALFQRVVPALKLRVGGDETVEDSEELRLGMVRLLRGDLTKKCRKDCVQAYVNEMAAIVLKGLDDPFHEVKKETCRFLEEASALIQSEELLSDHVESILKCLVRNMAHPHYKVRTLLVSATDAMVRLKPPKHLVDKYVVTILHEVAFDKSPQVRKIVYKSLASWLTIVEQEVGADLAGEEESVLVPLYAEILLPFYLIGLLDDDASIREAARIDLEALYQANKAKGCYCSVERKEEPNSAPMVVEVTGEDDVMAEAKNGASLVREMVKFHLPHIVSVCKRDTGEWTRTKNLSASRLLHTTTEVCGADMTPFLDTVVPLLCSAVGNESEDIAHYIVFSSHHVGSACDPTSWACLLIDALNNPKTTVVSKANALVVLAGLIHGCALSEQGIQDDVLCSLAATLASEEIRRAGHYAINTQLLAVIVNLLEAFGQQCKGVSQDLYHILLQLQALEGDHSIQSGASQVTHKLALMCGYQTTADFASELSEDLLRVLCGTCGEWIKDSPDRFVFAALIFNCSVDVLTRLYDQVSSVFISCVDQERDPHVRLETLKLVDRLLEDKERNQFLLTHSKSFLTRVLLPPAVWQAGKTAASIRFHAIVAIASFFRENLMTSKDLARILLDDAIQLLPTLHSSLEEDYYADTRLSSCHALEALLTVIGTRLTNDQKRLVYPELVKRLDDSNDKVRIQTCVTLEALVDHCLTADYCDTNTGYLLKGVLIHMDDTNPKVQEAVCVVVEKLAKIKPGVTRGCLHEVRDQHRGVGYIDRVLNGM